MHPNPAGTTGDIVWRPAWSTRVPTGAACLVVAALAVWGAATRPTQPLFYALIVVMLFGATVLRPKAVLGDDSLDAQGRFAHRRIDLADVRQVGTGLGGHVWVQTHGPLDGRGNDVLYLRMIPRTVLPGAAARTAAQAVGLIRDRAAARGARLDPPPAGPARAPSRRPLLFST